MCESTDYGRSIRDVHRFSEKYQECRRGTNGTILVTLLYFSMLSDTSCLEILCVKCRFVTEDLNESHVGRVGLQLTIHYSSPLEK